MKRTKAIGVTVLALLLLTALLVGACAKPSPSPSPTPKPPSPSPATAAKPPSTVAKPPSTAPAPAARPAALAQIIEAAKKEGALIVTLSSTHTPAPVVARMKKEIKDLYGIDLDLKVTGTEGMGQILASAIMEYKTGTTPNYDSLYMGSDTTVFGQREGIFEMVDWKPLLESGTVPEVIPTSPEISAGLIVWSGISGIMYNSKKVSKSDVPKTLAELGDPKWKGRFGIMHYPDYYARWASMLGQDKMKSWLQAIMKNQPVIEQMARLNSRFVLGEIDVALISATYLDGNREKGVPSEWQSLDFVESRDFQIMVQKGARHPNAAKLFAIYMVSPVGQKLNFDVGKGNRFYPFGGLIYDMVKQATQKNAFYTLDNRPDLLKFTLTKDYEKLQEEYGLILKGS